MNYKCKQCGESFVIDEKTKVCPHCGLPISEENDVSEEKGIKQARELKIQKESDLKKLVADYGKSGDSKDLKVIIPAWDEFTAIPDFNRVWRDFIINAAGAAVSKKDKDLQIVLKNHAHDFDAAREGSDLFLSLLKVHAKLGTTNDWEELIQRTDGDQTKFAVICDSIMYRIIKNKDKAFAIDVFKFIKSKGDAWADAGRIYIRTLLSSEEVANEVFTKAAFNASTSKFAESLRVYCKKHLEKGHGITVEQTKVWENHVAACRARKKRAWIITGITVAVILAIAIGTLIYLNAVDKDTIVFDVEGHINVLYEENNKDLPLDGYTVTYKKNSGKEITEPLTMKMVSGYDHEIIDRQQNVTFTFKGITKTVTVLVKRAQLDAPVLKQEGNYITWEKVLNADYYEVSVNATSLHTEKTTALSYDLSKNTNYGELQVMVRAGCDSGKYDVSPMSAALTVTKLQAPSGFNYANGKLTWVPVAGAASYELLVNGTHYTVTSPECAVNFVKGDNTIVINAKGADGSIVYGVTEEMVEYDRLAPIAGMSYQGGNVLWEPSEGTEVYDVYVNETLWRSFSRTSFSIVADNFTFGDGIHKIGVVCRSSKLGTEASETKEYMVAIGNHIRKEGNALVWDSVGLGATYTVSINGTALPAQGATDLDMLGRTWQIGNNTVSVNATLGGMPYVCETVNVVKLAAPTLSATSAGWSASGSAQDRFSVNGGAWVEVAGLPDISTIGAGEHTVKMKRVVSSATALEIESDEVTVKMMRAAAPTIRVMGGILNSSYDQNSYDLSLFYCLAGSDAWSAPSDLSAITAAGTYKLRATLTPKASAFPEHAILLPSVYSAECSAIKPEAPNVTYDVNTRKLSSTTVGAKFYYVDEAGMEHEVKNGDANELPGGVFEIYARLAATDVDMLHSENTPSGLRASVFNLDIGFQVTPISGGNQCWFEFSGCGDISSLTYKYTIEYLDASNNKIGGIDKTDTWETVTAKRGTSIVKAVNYRLEGVFDDGYSHANVKKIRVTVMIDGGADTLVKTHTAVLQ